MGVRVTREFTNGRKETTNYVCFGFLASEQDQNADVTHLHYHYNHEFQSGRWGSGPNDQFKNEMSELFRDTPMFKNFSIHPRKEVVTVSNMDSIPTDEAMTGLFIVRNLCKRPNMIHTYKWLRDRGFRPLIAMTVSHLYSRRESMGSFDSADTRWSRQAQTEGSVFHQATFGREAFLRMIRQDYSKRIFHPWNQEPFTEQRRYLRDSIIQDLRGHTEHVLDQNGVMTRGRGNKPTTRHATYMATALSVLVGKETPLHQSGVRHQCSDDGMVQFINSFLPARFKVA